MSSIVILDTNSSFFNYSKLVGIWDGVSLGDRRSSNASGVSSWPKIPIFQVSTQEASLMHSFRVTNWVGYDPLSYLSIPPGDRCPVEPPLLGMEGSDDASDLGF